jgi:antitoxin (DNA-binding transcriptional repressor) of toxin-antitoxin stability system
MKVISIYEAKTQLSKLVDMALAGQEVVIARRKTPLVTLQPIRTSNTLRKTGTLPGLVVVMEETFNDSLDDWADDPVLPGGVAHKPKARRTVRK